MESILIACGDTDLLRQIAADLPVDQFKPIATRKGAGIPEKLAGRGLALAIVHETLQDGHGAVLCQALKAMNPQPVVLLLVTGDAPKSGPFDLALRYPVPGPVLRNALKKISSKDTAEQDMERWRAFFDEVNQRIRQLGQQSYYQMMGVRPDAPHHAIVQVFDAISQRYHPDRYTQFRGERWGAAVYEQVNQLYKTYTEAFGVLSDRKLRQKYDDALTRGELRLADDAALDTGPRNLSDFGQTPQARKFLKLAQTDIARRDWNQALQNLNFALSLEPDNQAIQAKIAELKNQSAS